MTRKQVSAYGGSTTGCYDAEIDQRQLFWPVVESVIGALLAGAGDV